MIRLKYGNTSTFFIPGERGGLLVDTDWAGTLPAFFRALGQCGVQVGEIAYVLATHYHPDHMGLIPELMRLGVRLLLMDTQREDVHFADAIFTRDRRLRFSPIDETRALVLPCSGSRAFLAELGIHGEILSTPSHSRDSVSLLLDDGCCLAGDLEPPEHLPAWPDDSPLRADWDAILRRRPVRILYAHRNDTVLDPASSAAYAVRNAP